MKERKPKGKTGAKTQARREEIKRLIEELGVWNISKAALAEKYGCDRSVIYNDISSIIEGCRIEDITEIQVSISLAYKKAIKEMLLILANRDSTKQDKTRAASVIGKLNNEYTSMLENFNLKEKVAEKILHEGIGTTIKVYDLDASEYLAAYKHTDTAKRETKKVSRKH